MKQDLTAFYNFLVAQRVITRPNPADAVKYTVKYMDQIAEVKKDQEGKTDFCTFPQGKDACRYIHKDKCFCKELRKCQWAK